MLKRTRTKGARKALPELRRWMKDHQMTQRGIARYLSKGEATVSRAFAGERPFSVDDALRLSSLTHISPVRLVPAGKAKKTLELLVERLRSNGEIPKDSVDVA